MYIVIIGGGRVGYYLGKALIEEGNEVLIVEKDKGYCERINEELGTVCNHGDGCEANTLADIGTSRADIFVAVTGDDEDNLVSCQLAKHRFNVPRTIARIRNPRNADLFKKLGVDVTVSATDIILEAIEKEVPTHPLTHLVEIEGKGLEIVDIKIVAESPSIGKSLKELSLPEKCIVVLIIRKTRDPVVPNNNTIIEVDDEIIVVTPPDKEEELRTILRRNEAPKA